MRKFWEIEEKSTHKNKWSNEEKECEQFYAATTKRDDDGRRYVVRLPFKKNEKGFGRSKHIAVSYLKNLETRFRKNPELKKKYTQCIRDYIDLGHVVPAKKQENYYRRSTDESETYDCFFLPHLAVIKEQSSTTKIRVVFHASSKSSNGVSLNDSLMIGPTIEPDVVDKEMRIRLFKYLFLCDAQQMYRQFRMHEADWPFQQFVWRENENDPIQEYCLATVMFGEASAPFSAIRTIEQIAKDNQSEFPLAAAILRDNTHVDDIHQGGDTIEEMIQSRDARNNPCYAQRWN